MIRKNAVSLILTAVLALTILAGSPVVNATSYGPAAATAADSCPTLEIWLV